MKIALLAFVLFSQVAQDQDCVPLDLQGIWKPTSILYSETRSGGTYVEQQIDCKNRAWVIFGDGMLDIYSTSNIEGSIEHGLIRFQTLSRSGNRYFFWFKAHASDIGARRRAILEFNDENQIQLHFMLNRSDGAKVDVTYILQRYDDKPPFSEALEKAGARANPSGQWEVLTLDAVRTNR